MDKKQQVPCAVVTDRARCSTPLTFMGYHNAWLMWEKLRVERGYRDYFIKNKWIWKSFFLLAVYFSELPPCKSDVTPLCPPWTQWDISEQILHCTFGLSSFNIRKKEEKKRCLFCYSYFWLFCQQTMLVFKKSELKAVPDSSHMSPSSKNAFLKRSCPQEKKKRHLYYSVLFWKIKQV